MPELGLTDNTIKKYHLIRSKRKTLSLQINNSAQLVVRAPQRLSIKEVNAFIDEKADWINKKSRSIKSNLIPKPNYSEGEQFLYLGNQYPLTHNTEQKITLNFDGVAFRLNGDGYSAFHAWYKLAFKKIAVPRLEYYAELSQLSYQQVRLSRKFISIPSLLAVVISLLKWQRWVRYKPLWKQRQKNLTTNNFLAISCVTYGHYS